MPNRGHKVSRELRAFGVTDLVVPGESPGTLTQQPDAGPSLIHIIAYGPDAVIEEGVQRAEDLARFVGKYPILWVNVDGVGSADVVRKIGEIFNLHALALEDVMNIDQRAKVEPYEGCVYVVARMVEMKEHLETEQLSLFVGPGFVITFQEAPGDCFDPVRKRIRNAAGRMRRSGADYLAYAIIDAAIDHYFPLLEAFGERLETLEDETLDNPRRDTVVRVHIARRELMGLRRAIWPLRDALNVLVRESLPPFTDETRIYLRDCHDHTVRVIEIIETYRELAAGFMEIYLSSQSNRLNEVMKVLTIISTIFIPLSFIASVYGMNFHTDHRWNMPELNWEYGYLLVLGIMGAVGFTLLGFFYRRGWLTGDDSNTSPKA